MVVQLGLRVGLVWEDDIEKVDLLREEFPFFNK
jgi:hypothetical protein